jgi:hypothetical protein
LCSEKASAAIDEHIHGSSDSLLTDYSQLSVDLMASSTPQRVTSPITEPLEPTPPQAQSRQSGISSDNGIMLPPAAGTSSANNTNNNNKSKLNLLHTTAQIKNHLDERLKNINKPTTKGRKRGMCVDSEEEKEEEKSPSENEDEDEVWICFTLFVLEVCILRLFSG